MQNFNKSLILIAPLDWGLGHTTRCIPIIITLKKANYDVVVAACAKQKNLLQQEFSDLRYIDLAGYNISYSKNKWFFIAKMILQIPKILWCIYKENKWLNKIVEQEKIDVVISDNRYGLYSKKIKSIFITHQLQINTGNSFSELVLQKINYYFINKFNCCWVPDLLGENNIAGNLSHPKKMPKTPVKYIGILNRFNKIETEIKYDLCVLLSGPEPQRTLLENKLLQQLKNIKNKKILFVRGLPNAIENIVHSNCTIKNHLAGKELQEAICSSNIIVARSGYTTVMELLSLQKKMILIATPMQTEQEYLAMYLANKKYCISYTQNKINIVDAFNKAIQFNYESIGNIVFDENLILENLK